MFNATPTDPTADVRERMAALIHERLSLILGPSSKWHDAKDDVCFAIFDSLVAAGFGDMAAERAKLAAEASEIAVRWQSEAVAAERERLLSDDAIERAARALWYEDLEPPYGPDVQTWEKMVRDDGSRADMTTFLDIIQQVERDGHMDALVCVDTFGGLAPSASAYMTPAQRLEQWAEADADRGHDERHEQ